MSQGGNSRCSCDESACLVLNLSIIGYGPGARTSARSAVSVVSFSVTVVSGIVELYEYGSRNSRLV